MSCKVCEKLKEMGITDVELALTSMFRRNNIINNLYTEKYGYEEGVKFFNEVKKRERQKSAGLKIVKK